MESRERCDFQCCPTSGYLVAIDRSLLLLEGTFPPFVFGYESVSVPLCHSRMFTRLNHAGTSLAGIHCVYRVDFGLSMSPQSLSGERAISGQTRISQPLASIIFHPPSDLSEGVRSLSEVHLAFDFLLPVSWAL